MMRKAAFRSAGVCWAGVVPRGLPMPHRGILLFLLFISAGLSGIVSSQEPSASRATVPYRRIFFYQDEAARLVPSDFRAVSADDLQSLLLRPAAVASPDDGQPRLNAAEYWVSFHEGTLRSDLSRFEITYQDDAPGELNLGTVNLALRDQESELTDLQPPYLHTASDGTLRAAVSRDCETTFGWSLNAQRIEEGTHHFELIIPPCATAPLYLDLPRDSRLAATNGIPIRLTGPPPNASNEAMESPRLWYKIEAGGLSRLKLDIVAEANQQEEVIVPIRQQSTAFRIGPAGIRWTTQMTIERLEENSMPPLNVGETRITSVRVDGQPVEWNESPSDTGAQETRIQLTTPRELAERSRSVTTNIAISGMAPVLIDRPFELPYPRWEDCYPAMMMPNVQTQLTIDGDLTLARLELPDDWDAGSVEWSAGGDLSYQISGPSHSVERPRIRLLRSDATLTAAATLQLDVAETQIEARWNARIDMGEDGPQPLTIQVEPQWRIDSIVLPTSERVIEVPAEIGQRRLLTVWPEAADLEENILHLRIRGHQLSSSLPTVGQRGASQIPATWFVRLQDCRVDTVAAINPPVGWRWPGESIIRSQTISEDELTEPVRSMFGKLSSKSLLFTLPQDSTPTLKLERPLPVVEADVTLSLTRDDAIVTETLTVNLYSPGDAFSEVRVRTGLAHGRPPLSWSMAGSPTQTGPLASLDEGTDRSGDDETWVISPSANRSGELNLIAKRRYRVDQAQRIDLPTVAQAVTHQSATGIAANQDTSVLIGRGLHVNETTGPVQRIPATTEDAPGWRRLRYDPSEPAAIVLTNLEYSPAPGVIWEERVRSHTSARWGDTIIAQYETDGQRPLRIQFDPAMTLEEASTGGRPFVLSEITSDRDSVVIPATSEKQRLRLQFRRPVNEGGLTRWWKPPFIRPEAIVLRSQWSVHPVADTVIPEWNRGWIDGAVESSSAMEANREVEGIIISPAASGLWLVANEGFWAFGTGIALFAFSLAWWMARYQVSMLVVAFPVAACLAIWWPRAGLAITGFVVLPTIAGGLLEAARRRFIIASQKTHAGTRRESESASFSAVPRIPLILMACLGFFASAAESRGQDAPSVASGTDENVSGEAALDTTANPLEKSSLAYPVLIPVDEVGEPAGSTVYIPESMYDLLFLRSTVDQKPSDLRLRHADYRVRLGGGGIGRDSQMVRVEARLTIQSDRAGQEMQLPFLPAMVQSTEIVLGDDSRTIRWLPSGDGISLMLPRRGINQLRVGLLPEATRESDDVSTLRLRVPPMMWSQLTLDADAPLQSVDVEPCHGERQFDASAGRFSADLGAVDSIGLRWQFRRDIVAESTTPLIRRWLVHVGAEKVITECEMDLSTLVTAAGDEVQLDLYHEMPARVTSRDWKADSLEPYDAMRRRLTVQAMESSPRPLRLMWESDMETLEAANDDSRSRLFTPPNVRPVRALDLGRSFMAIDADPSFQVDLAANSAAEIENDRFLEGWTPRVDLIDRAYVTEGAPPRLTLHRRAENPWQAEERQHLHVSLDNTRGDGHLALDYQARVIPGDRAVGPMRLILPTGMHVQQLKLDGRSISSTPRETSAGVLELSLPDRAPREAFQLELEAWMPLDSNHRFSPPRVVLAPVGSVTGFYLMTRGSNVMIQEREATDLPQSEVTVPNATRLSEGIVPRWSWRLEEASSPARPALPGIFEVTPNPTETRASQITDLFWQDGRWSMETVFDIESVQGQVDFLAFELPTRWSDELEISPAISWSLQPAAEPTKRLVRILPEDPSSGRQQIRIRSRLRSSDSGQVSVPDVRLLGEGERRRFIGMPPRLTNDPIRWEPSGARRVQRPKVFQNAKGIDENQLVYEVSGNWFAKLVSVMATRRRSTAPALDIQLFPQQDQSILAICRWDLLPADRSDVQIQIPPGAEPLGVWSAGLQASESRQDDLLNVSLNLSRLGQSIELLVRLEQQKTSSELALPQLIGIPVQTTWVARYEEHPEANVSDQTMQRTIASATPTTASGELEQPESDGVGWRIQNADDRALALVESIADVLEGSLDSLAQRPNDEIAAWLLPWLDRADQLLPMVDGFAPSHDAPNSSPDSEDDPSSIDVPLSQPIGAANVSERAQALTARLEGFTSSVLGTSDVAPYRDAPSRYWFSIASEDWTPRVIAMRPGQAESIPTDFLRTPRESSWWDPERVAAGIGLLVFGLVFWRLRGVLSQVIASPAFWLFGVGVVGLVLAPLPVAITICLIALISPLLPATQRVRQR